MVKDHGASQIDRDSQYDSTEREEQVCKQKASWYSLEPNCLVERKQEMMMMIIPFQKPLMQR